MVAVHLHFTLDHPALAGGAHTGLARVGQLGTNGVAGVEHVLGVARQVESKGAAVADHGDVAKRRIHLACRLTGFAAGLAAGGGEQLEVDAFLGHAVGLQAVTHGLGHRLRAADECCVQAGNVQPARKQLAAFVGVDAAVVQVNILLFAAEHENQVQAVEVTVFQVFELVAEQRPRTGAVAVQQGETAVRLAGQRSGDDRQYRGDAAAGGHTQIVALASRVQRHEEAARWRHHFQLLAGLEHFIGKRREAPARYALDGHAQFAVL
ncbi:hypothetical protein D3C79_589860 [compost metagenome]